MSDQEFHPVAEVASLSLGMGRTVHLQGRNFAVYNFEGNFYAIDDECPHKGASLGAGFLEYGHVICPLHAWRFDIKNGYCFNNPQKPVKTYPTRVVDGWVQICIS